MAKVTLTHWLSRLQVGQKIGLGYALALGIAVSGTIAGFGLGNYHIQQSTQREESIRNEVELLHRLQTGILQVRTHQQQLIPLSQHPEEFAAEYAHILRHQHELENTWSELRSFLKPIPDSVNAPDNKRSSDLSTFIQTYDGVPERYLGELNVLVQQIQTLNLQSPADVKQAQAILLQFTNSTLALKYDEISDDLIELIEQSYHDAGNAEQEFREAGYVAQKIVAVSIGLSIAIAILFAIFTSHAIAQPIRSLTRIAQRSTKESNFDLQAPIDSEDEIGILADAFNQLIQSVKQLLEEQQIAHQQLTTYSQTLEQKVEERTQELSDNNERLQELVSQLRQTQIQMVHSEKMSSLGQLVAGVAHEINNPVNFIHGNLAHIQEYAYNLMSFVQLYQKYYPTPIAEIAAEADEIDLEFLQDDLPKLLNSMRMGTDRIRKIVLSLRHFSRMDESKYRAVDIHEGIDSTLLILQYRLKAKPECPGIEIVRDYGDLPPVECYAGQLNQAVMNIVVNAIDALEEANAKRTYQDIQANPSRITIRTAIVNERWVEIAIADNGPGIPEAVLQKIFDPFFTTKPVGKGTGMGMSICHQIITEKHGGKLDCFSNPGEGAEFVLQIPIQQDACEIVRV
jgi:signal transduction histidine kinase